MGAAVIEEEDYVLLLSNRRDRWIPRDKQIPATSENLLELAAMCDLNIQPPQGQQKNFINLRQFYYLGRPILLD